MVQWKKTKLGELSDRITKGSTPTSYGYKFLDEGIPFVKVENLANGMINRESISQYISEDAHESQKRSQLQAGDVLFSIAGTIGRVALVTDKDVPANTNQAVAIIRGVTKHFIPDFLKMQLDSHVSLKVRSKARGGAMNNISLEDLNKMDVIVPPLDVQESIVQAVDTQFTRLDAAIKSLKAIKAKLGLYRKSVLKAAFEGKLATVSGWEDITVGDLGEIITGTTPSKSKAEYYGNERCFFKPTDLNAGYYVKKSQDMLSAKGAEQARLLPGRSILVTCIGATIGKTGFNRVEGATNQQINAVVPDQSKYVPELLFYLFVSDNMQKQIIGNSSSTTLPILNKSKFSRLSVRIPKKKEEQDKIVDAIEACFSVIEKVEAVVNTSLEKSEKLRKSILKSAFEGKLVN